MYNPEGKLIFLVVTYISLAKERLKNHEYYYSYLT